MVSPSCKKSARRCILVSYKLVYCISIRTTGQPTTQIWQSSHKRRWSKNWCKIRFMVQSWKYLATLWAPKPARLVDWVGHILRQSEGILGYLLYIILGHKILNCTNYLKVQFGFSDPRWYIIIPTHSTHPCLSSHMLCRLASYFG